MGKARPPARDAGEERRRPLNARAPRPYANPYVAGASLGLVLLGAFVVSGHGLGASGAFASVAAATVHTVNPAAATANPYFQRYLAGGARPWTDWLVVELAGAVAGAWLSARFASRVALTIERGIGLRASTRLILATLGGVATGAGAVFARGCTSGQALSGGAMLSLGSWLFIAAAFGAAYATAPLLRRAWQ